MARDLFVNQNTNENECFLVDDLPSGCLPLKRLRNLGSLIAL